MSDHDDHFDDFDAHTRLKHFILNAYLHAWALKLLGSGHFGRRVWFVDGFAGTGADSKGRPGSPTIACRTAIAVRAKRPDCSLGIVCVEEMKSRFRQLESHLAPFRAQEGAKITTLCGRFSDQLPAVLALTKSEPVLSFLDPFGLGGLDAATYRPLLGSRGSEIFALVADAGGGRLSGALNANDARFARAAAEAVEAPTLFEDMNRDRLARIEHARQAQVRSAAASRRIITQATGDAEQPDRLMGLAPSAARVEIVEGIERALRHAGALYLTRIGVRAADGTHKHLLVHATASPKGVLAMKQAISQSLSNEAIDPSVRQHLREDHSVPISEVANIIEHVYAGTSTPWSIDVAGVRDQVLLSLPIFPFQMADLKQELKRRGSLQLVARKEALIVPSHTL